MTRRVLLLALLGTLPGLGLAAENADNGIPKFYVEYVSGHAGQTSSFEGILTIEGGTVRLVKNWRKQPFMFAIPLATITEAKATIGRDIDGFGDTWRGYVTITVETREGAEAILLKVMRKHAADVAAKINFASRQARAEANP
jgi:hypothetical protein